MLIVPMTSDRYVVVLDNHARNIYQSISPFQMTALPLGYHTVVSDLLHKSRVSVAGSFNHPRG